MGLHMTGWGILASLPFFLLAASHLGALHPAGDSLAVFRPWLVALAALAVALLLARGHRGAALAGMLVMLASGATLLRAWLPAGAVAGGGAGVFTHYQKNMSYRLADTAPLAEDIRAVAPDFITLQEVTYRNARLLAVLAEEYPAVQECPFAKVGGVVVASRWPKIAGSGRCGAGRGMTAMQVETPIGPVWVIAIHLHWPWPFGQPAQARGIAQDIAVLLDEDPAPVVIGGDFNMVPWSHLMGMMEQASGARRIGGVAPSFPLPKIGAKIPIDHVLASTDGGRLERRPRLGSDHFGIVARFALSRGAAGQ